MPLDQRYIKELKRIFGTNFQDDEFEENFLALLKNVTGITANETAIAAVRPYKVYTALLSQTGTDDPTVIVFENTIGDIVWTRQSTGVYRATLVGAFPTNKTFFFTGLYNANTPDIQTIQYLSEDLVQLYNYYLKLVLGEVGKELLDSFVNVPIEIRVYE